MVDLFKYLFVAGIVGQEYRDYMHRTAGVAPAV